MRARRGYLAPGGAVRGAPPPIVQPATAEVPGLEDALAPLARLRTTAELFTRTAVDAGTARVVVEISSSRSGASPWRDGADVQVVISGLDGASLPPVTGRIDPGARGVLLTASIAGAARPIRVTTRVSAGGQALEDSGEVRDTPRGIAGDPVLFRSRPAPTAPLRPAADLQFSRLERVHVEWPITGEVDQRVARLLGRNGSPLAVPVTVTERDVDGRRVLAADVNLAPLASGDYVIALTVGRGAAVEQKLVAFRVVQ